MKRTAVINVVGLTDSVLGSSTPFLSQYAQNGKKAQITPAFPAVTCTAQSTYLTGLTPSGHGIVGNGWYDRDLSEIQFWKQSNHLVSGKKLWEVLKEKDPQFTCAKIFWWYNMYSSADFSITPRPMYPADGRKVFDVYTHPASIREEIKKDLGEFPFPSFWGPLAGIKSSRWIAESAKWFENHHHPTLSLVYLPHLDYNLQRWGPNDSRLQQDYREIDSVVADLCRFYQEAGVQVAILSEYGITEVDHPIHINRILRQAGWITIKNELGLEMLDAGASRAFAVADHQVAHVYVNDPEIKNSVRTLLEKQAGIECVLDGSEQTARGLSHKRSGDLIVIADSNSWFTYYYWMNDDVAPDFARCVDIHRKAGYDPVELFIDPGIRFPKLKIAKFLLKKKLGFRTLMDVIPLDANLVKGSHGRIPDPVDYPILMYPNQSDSLPTAICATDVFASLIQFCSKTNS